MPSRSEADFGGLETLKAIVTGMKKLLLTVLLVGGFAVAQTTNVYIYDSSGNSTTGTISNGNVFFHDSNGNTTFGTIRDGQVFLNNSNGNTTFGTVRDGNVFLTDRDGLTTGTIRNGNIFLNNSDGSMTIGSYYNGSVHATATGGNTAATPSSATRQSDSSYQAGYAMGSALGAGIGRLILNHRLHSYCKKHPGETWHYRVQGAVRGEGTCPGSVYAMAPQRAMAPVRQTTAAIPAPALQPVPQPSVIGSVPSQPVSAGIVYGTTITQPGDRQEESLGDVARRYRAQKARQESAEQR